MSGRNAKALSLIKLKDKIFIRIVLEKNLRLYAKIIFIAISITELHVLENLAI